MYRCDHGSGSSLGPILTTMAGIEGVDVGAPMLAMHSIREIAGARDLPVVIAAFANAFSSAISPMAESGVD
jgi:aspartyl aminopeptidase